MGKRLAAAAVILLLLSASAAADRGGYRKSFRTFTHRAQMYLTQGWDAKLIWHATFFSDAFREEFIERHIAINHLDEADDPHDLAEAAAFTAEQQRRQAEGWDFFIGMYTKERFKDFSMYEDSFWKARLETESGEILRPIAVDKIPITPYEQEMFKYIDRWTYLYRVTFPKADLGQEFWLSLESVVGVSTIRWKLRQD